MAPKRATVRVVQKADRANIAVADSVNASGEAIVMQWMQDNPDKVSDLVVHLMSDGFKTKRLVKSPGAMSRGTLAVNDLPKRYLTDLLLRLEGRMPKDFMEAVYSHNTELLMKIFHMAMALQKGKQTMPLKIAQFFPRNYIGLEKCAEIRYEAFGRRLGRLAEFARGLTDSIDALVRNKMASFNLDKFGVFWVRKSMRDEPAGLLYLCHPSGFKVALESMR